MSLLTILKYPDRRLRKIAQPVEHVDESIKTLIEDMFETMYDANGIGLAATQINVHKQVIVMDLSEDKSAPRVFINPEITPLTEEGQPYDEGCLSVPGFYETVERPKSVKLNAVNEHGEAFEEQCDEMLAICIQHEIDHLNGKLFVDYLSKLKQNRIRKKLEKQQKEDKA